jgi:hypothetical protein
VPSVAECIGKLIPAALSNESLFGVVNNFFKRLFHHHAGQMDQEMRIHRSCQNPYFQPRAKFKTSFAHRKYVSGNEFRLREISSALWVSPLLSCARGKVA